MFHPFIFLFDPCLRRRRLTAMNRAEQRWMKMARYLRRIKRLGTLTSCLGEILKVYKGRRLNAVAAVHVRSTSTSSWRRFARFVIKRAYLGSLAGSLLSFFRERKHALTC